MNLRPSGYEPDELPNCSTPRYYFDALSLSAYLEYHRMTELSSISLKKIKYFLGDRREHRPRAEIAALHDHLLVDKS